MTLALYIGGIIGALAGLLVSIRPARALRQHYIRDIGLDRQRSGESDDMYERETSGHNLSIAINFPSFVLILILMIVGGGIGTTVAMVLTS